MDEKEARIIANEVLLILIGCKENFPGAYEYFMGEMDLSDEELETAGKVLFPG